MLKVDRLDAFYGDVQVLWKVTLEVQEGRIVAVIGPNGAGKSTLLKTIIGLVSPKGEEGNVAVFFRDRPLDGLVPEKVVRLGLTLVPEGARVFPEMTCRDNLMLGAYNLKDPLRQARLMEEVMELLPKLKERAKQKAKTLSGGERQMLAIGRALMGDPDFLLLDEPSLGLHPLMVSHIFKALEEINRRGKTILLVEQKVTFALKMCQYGYVMENGRIVLEGTGGDLMNNPHVRQAYLAM